MEDCIAFKGVNCINELLDHALTFTGEVKQVDNKIIDYTLHMIAHNESGFDTYVILYNLP